MAERRKLWAICNECQVTVIVDGTHLPRGQDIPPVEDWEEGFPSCPVCGATIAPADEDPTSYDEDIDWHREAATKRVLRTLLEHKDLGKLDERLDQLAAHYSVEASAETVAALREHYETPSP